jgi:hypothetical protein
MAYWAIEAELEVEETRKKADDLMSRLLEYLDIRNLLFLKLKE